MRAIERKTDQEAEMRSRQVSIIAVVALLALVGPAPQASAAGASSDYGRTFCQYLKNKALRASTPECKAKLMAEYRRCLKEKGEGW
jgi:hypothetical protein